MSGDRLAQIERYAKQPDIVGVLPQTHRMLPVADVLALVAIAKAAREVVWTYSASTDGVADPHISPDPAYWPTHKPLHDALARLDSER